MALSFVSANNAAGTGVTSLDCNLGAGTIAGDFIIAVYAFENVGPTSGPWVVPNIGQFAAGNIGPFNGNLLAAFKPPSATGIGIEVWVGILSSGSHFIGNFVSSQNVVVTTATYRGEFNPTGNINGGPPRIATAQQVVGNQPASPSVTANAGEMVIACAADAMTGSAFGTPSGFTNRVDARRAAAGTAESTIADSLMTAAVTTGPITFPNAAASSSQAGATVTLVVTPAPTVAGVGPVLDIPMPPELDLADGWTLRVSALDPTTGSPVSGVTVSNLAIEVKLGADTSPSDLEVGPYLLVPGSGA